MSADFKDYYKILGLSRTATADDIRKAFRKLARQYHPDVAKNKTEAEAKFKEINEAHEVLSDPDKRHKYDTFGADWNARPRPASARPEPGPEWNSGRPHEHRQAEYEFGGTGFSQFFEQMFGRGGANRGFAQNEGEDETARGRDVEADLLVTLSEAVSGDVRKITLRRQVRCEKCRGTGRALRRPCLQCNGTGYITKSETHQVKIPAGIRDGQKLRIAGHGEAGSGGGPAGDLYLRVKFAAHPDFRVEGGDLYYDLPIAPWEAALGAEVSVPTLAASVNIRIPAGTASGQKLRVKGRGLPDRQGGHGDLYVVAQIEVPPASTDHVRNLWKELAEAANFNPRA